MEDGFDWNGAGQREWKSESDGRLGAGDSNKGKQMKASSVQFRGGTTDEVGVGLVLRCGVCTTRLIGDICVCVCEYECDESVCSAVCSWLPFLFLLELTPASVTLLHACMYLACSPFICTYWAADQTVTKDDQRF